MLQLQELSRRTLERFPPLPPWSTLDELELAADLTLAGFRRQRQALAGSGSRWHRAQVWVDQRLRTERGERMDDLEYPEEAKLRLVRRLHGLNLALRSYPRVLSWLAPLVHRVVHEHSRPARVLELCCGSGELTMALAAGARRRGLAIEVTGSDIVPDHVEAATRRAARRRIHASFCVLDALDLGREAATEASYDVVLVSQSLHHFTAGQLARTIAGARRVGAIAYLGVDGRRSLPVLMGLPIVAALFLDADFLHDAVVTSLRLYSEAELALIARLAAPGAVVRVDQRGLPFSVVDVRF